jgi:hypothetical protein
MRRIGLPDRLHRHVEGAAGALGVAMRLRQQSHEIERRIGEQAGAIEARQRRIPR